MVSPSKKLQASAPFLIPETNVNFPLVVVQPSGWESQAPEMDEDEYLDEARSYETNTFRGGEHSPHQLNGQGSNAQAGGSSLSAAPVPTDSTLMAQPLSNGPSYNGPRAIPAQGFRAILNGSPNKTQPPAYNHNPNGGTTVAAGVPNKESDDSSIASSRESLVPTAQKPTAPTSQAKVSESRGEKRRLDEEEHEDEEAAEVEKAMVDEEGEGEHHTDSNSRAAKTNGSNGKMEERPAKKARVSKEEGKDEEEDEEKVSKRTSPRKAAATSPAKPAPAPFKRKPRPVAGEFVGSGRLVPVKDRPFGEATCHRCRHMKNKPECILHANESRCDKCIVDAQGCWWRKGPGKYESIAGSTPQKKLVDSRDGVDKKPDTGKGQTESAKKSAAAAKKPVDKGKKRDDGKGQAAKKEKEEDPSSSSMSEEEEEEEEADRPLTRKSLRAAAASTSKASEPSSSTGRKSTRVSARLSGSAKKASTSAHKGASGSSKKTPARSSKRALRKVKRSASESESSSSSEESDSGSESDSESESSESPPPRPVKALKGKAALKEDPNVAQQLQRLEKAESKLRDELWTTTWEKERLVKNEKRLKEELEDILKKKAEIGS
ncbi:hypothetical protein BXZ70DRAFT_1060375 [Cristinia sonorae]|uniref:Uncharacterized protein n=1 Tax=Cristinia sonorae TaxID=1940300 RepID=A0A8K0XVC7_9AGAR|nr:hypothetical protein BXZ70DRAFT_1060375 [Cristinia sonorae]